MLFACLQELLPMNCKILGARFFFLVFAAPTDNFGWYNWRTGLADRDHSLTLVYVQSVLLWASSLPEPCLREISGRKKGLAEEGEKKGEGGRVEQGHSETLPLARKQEFRMVSDLFQHAANVWRKLFFIHHCCSWVCCIRETWRIQGPWRTQGDAALMGRSSISLESRILIW